jgi:outer membrane protein assembly factor BamA
MRFAAACLFSFVCLFSPFTGSAQVSTEKYCTVSDIIIAGNKITRETVILRELPFRKNDMIALSRLNSEEERGEQFLMNTTLFNNVNITDSVVTTEGVESRVYIFIKVKERFYWEPSLHFDLADRNFNAWWQDKLLYRTILGGGLTYRNFRGLNQRIGFDATVGWRKSLTLSYAVPFLNRAQTFGLATNLFYLSGHEVGAITEQNKLKYLRADDRHVIQKIGGDLTFTYRPKLVVRHSLRVGYEYYAIDDMLAKFRNPDYLGQGRNILHLPRIAYILSVDHRDNVIYPWAGNYFIGAIEQKGNPFGKTDINIQTLELNYRHFIAFKPKLSLGMGFRTILNRPDTLPYLLRSSLGYRYQVRGFEYYVLDGYNYFMFTSELRYRILDTTFHFSWVPIEAFRSVPLMVNIKILYDQGYVSYPVPTIDRSGNDLLNKWIRGWGAGIDFLTYYDKILRVEYCFNSLRQSGLFLHYIEAF